MNETGFFFFPCYFPRGFWLVVFVINIPVGLVEGKQTQGNLPKQKKTGWNL